MPTVVDLWWARPTDERDSHLALLSSQELQRRDRFRRSQDCARFTVAATLLRVAAGLSLANPAAQMYVDRSCARCAEPHGRPRLPGTGLHASISHAGDRIVVALTEGGQVGVDVEQVVCVDSGFAQLVSSVYERFPLDDQYALFVHWSRKEAVLKATGEGLAMPMGDVVLGPPDRPPVLLRYGASADVRAAMAQLDPGNGYVGCVVVLDVDGIVVRNRDGSALLASL